MDTSQMNMTGNNSEETLNSLKISGAWNLADNVRAGRLIHEAKASQVTKTVEEYLLVFENNLTGLVSDFLTNRAKKLDAIIKTFTSSPDYDRLLDRGHLAAVRYYDTYAMTSADGSMFESLPHFYMRIAAFCSTECTRRDPLKKTLKTMTLLDGRPVKHEIDCFLYFFQLLTKLLIIPPTPVLRGAGTRKSNLSSCFILSPELSSERRVVDRIMGDLSEVLKAKSGVGLNLSNFSQDGKSILSLLKVVNSQVEYFNDKNKRPVSVAAYLEIWHSQIQEFLSARMPENPDRCGAVFQGLCIPSLFFEMYDEDPDGMWYLFDPAHAPQLVMLYGQSFNEEYLRLVVEKKYSATVPLKALLFQLINCIIKTGSPYIICKDACNKHHWRETQGAAINSSNLCAEIIQQASEKSTAVCNLANVCLPSCVRTDRRVGVMFDFALLQAAVEGCVLMINASMGATLDSVESVIRGQSARSMGIGVHGLADVFALLGWDYLDQHSALLDKGIFESLYYHAVRMSNLIVLVGGGKPFPGWEESNLANGKFHWEGWKDAEPTSVSHREWTVLRAKVTGVGTYNSQFIALMPTVGCSQLTGYSESFNPFFANIVSKVTNKEEVLRPNLTFLSRIEEDDRPQIRLCVGEVSKLPEPLRRKYSNFLSAFDMDPEDLIKRSRARAPYVDQSQSFSFFLKEELACSAKYLKKLLFLGHSLGLKTIMYYCRIKKITEMSDLECLAGKAEMGELGYGADSTKESSACSYKEGGHGDRQCTVTDPSTCSHCQ